MKNELEFAGAALATTFVLRELLAQLLQKQILSKAECAELIDRSLLSLEQQQAYDVPENSEVWQIAREFLDHMMAVDHSEVAVLDSK